MALSKQIQGALAALNEVATVENSLALFLPTVPFSSLKTNIEYSITAIKKLSTRYGEKIRVDLNGKCCSFVPARIGDVLLQNPTYMKNIEELCQERHLKMMTKDNTSCVFYVSVCPSPSSMLSLKRKKIQSDMDATEAEAAGQQKTPKNSDANPPHHEVNVEIIENERPKVALERCVTPENDSALIAIPPKKRLLDTPRPPSRLAKKIKPVV